MTTRIHSITAGLGIFSMFLVTSSAIELPKVGLTMDLPPLWAESGSVKGATILGFYQPEGAKGLHPSLTVSLEKADDKSLEDFAKQIATAMPNATVKASAAEKVNGIDAWLLNVSNASLLGEIRVIRLLTRVDGGILVIGFADKAAAIDAASEQEFLKCLRSLKPR